MISNWKHQNKNNPLPDSFPDEVLFYISKKMINWKLLHYDTTDYLVFMILCKGFILKLIQGDPQFVFLELEKTRYLFDRTLQIATLTKLFSGGNSIPIILICLLKILPSPEDILRIAKFKPFSITNKITISLLQLVKASVWKVTFFWKRSKIKYQILLKYQQS